MHNVYGATTILMVNDYLVVERHTGHTGFLRKQRDTICVTQVLSKFSASSLRRRT